MEYSIREGITVLEGRSVIVRIFGTVQPLVKWCGKGNTDAEYLCIYAVEQYVNLHNSLPNIKHLRTPNEVVGSLPPVNTSNRFLYSFRDLITFRLPSKEWKFDNRYDLGFYMGESEGIKGDV